MASEMKVDKSNMSHDVYFELLVIRSTNEYIIGLIISFDMSSSVKTLFFFFYIFEITEEKLKFKKCWNVSRL